MIGDRSLKQQLGITVGVVILIVGATISTVVFLSVERLLIARTDDDLERIASRPELNTALPDNGGIERSGLANNENDESFYRQFAIRTLDADGVTVGLSPSGFASSVEPQTDISQLTTDDIATMAGTAFTATDVDGGGRRVLIQELPGGGWVLISQSFDSTDDLLSRVLLVSIMTTVMAAGAGVVGSWLLVGRCFRPVETMIDSATAIAAGERERRIDAGSGDTELGRLGTALDHMVEHMAAADAEREADTVRRRRFVDDASHELRTPVATIVGYAELYEQGGLGEQSQLERAMGRIGEAGRRAECVIEDLLTLARLDNEVSRRLETVDLQPLIEDLAAETAQVTSRNIAASTSGPVIIHGDRIWLTQAVANIVRNSLTYAPPEKPVTVCLTDDGTSAQIRVIDHGPGVVEAERTRIFDRFVRLDQGRERSQGGAGLGLAIVREVVDGHHGQVELTETPGGGATVTIRIPLPASHVHQ